MTELEVIATAAGILAVLVLMFGAAAASRGWVEGSVTVKVIPPWKRGAPGPKTVKAGPERAAEGDGVARLPERGAA